MCVGVLCFSQGRSGVLYIQGENVGLCIVPVGEEENVGRCR